MLQEVEIDDEPITLAPVLHPQPIDIEKLLQWAVARSGRLPWLRDGWRELSMNRGLTARPRKREFVGWEQAQVYALTVSGRGRPLPARMIPGPDAQRVLAAIQALDDPATAAVVLACARAKIHPDWMPGIEPKRVLRPVYGHKRNRKRRGRPVMVPTWEPCSPSDVRAARTAYSQWHKALSEIADRLDGQLAAWRIDGIAADSAPWEQQGEKSS